MTVSIDGMAVGSGRDLLFIGGPCVIESAAHALRHAREIAEICREVGMPYVYKTSYDKANRSSGKSYRGPGVRQGIAILRDVRRKVKVPVLTDVHSPEEARQAARVADVLQIPAFLCRQTDLVRAAGKTGRVVNIKKGQFVAPWDMKHIAEKAGSARVLLTERGTTFGYNNLVVDMKAIPIMKAFGYPVIMDAGHAVQQPGGLGHASGGMREMIPTLARAGVAAGADGLFIEVHENPDRAPSDGPNMLPLSELETLLREIKQLRDVVTSNLRR